MATEPIVGVKQHIQEALDLCDNLIRHINSSDQKKARETLENIEQSLANAQKSIQNDFGWILPQQPPKKKSWF